MESEEHPYVYCFVETGRKAWHHGDNFDEWDEIDFSRDDYVDSFVFRKRKDALTEEDKKTVEVHGIPYSPSLHQLGDAYEAKKTPEA